MQLLSEHNGHHLFTERSGVLTRPFESDGGGNKEDGLIIAFKLTRKIKKKKKKTSIKG